MPRIARLVGTGYPHHVIQRGNNKEKVFLDKEDFQKYISLLERYSSEKEASILAYGLMTNHVHLLVKPLKENTVYSNRQRVLVALNMMPKMAVLAPLIEEKTKEKTNLSIM